MNQIDWSQYATLTTDRPARVAARLRKLAAHLRKVKPSLFDMAAWGTKTNCGTVACVAGHACAVFPKELRLTASGYSDGLIVYSRDGLFDGTDAFRAAIGLDDDPACALTQPDALHRTPKLAARECERLAKEIEKRARKR